MPPFAPLELARAGSVFVTRPTLFDWIAEPAMRDTAWARLCGLIADGTVYRADLKPGQAPEATFCIKAATVTATKADGSTVVFDAVVRIDTPGEADYYRNGGILQYVLRSLVAA